MKWLPWLVFAIFGFFLLGSNFNAKLGMIDDHEIAMFLGNDGQVKLSEIVPTIVTQTEVGQWGSYLRYRPSYYTLRVIETSLWGDNAQLWYLSRYLMFVASMWLAWKILTHYFPKILSYLFVFYIMTMPFWPDLLTRLGPSEIYAVPSLLLFVYGLISNKWWMITLGYMVCIGAKENFLILFPIVLAWGGYRAYMKKLSRTEGLAILTMVAYTLWITLAIVVATVRAGADIYGTKISYRYRITKLFLDLPKIIQNKNAFLAVILMTTSVITGIWYNWKWGIKKTMLTLIFSQLGLIMTLLVIVASQYIFYINMLPSNMRYDFPVMILFPVIDLIVLRMIILFFAQFRYGNLVKILGYGAVMIVCLYYILHRGYTLIHLQSERNVIATQHFETQLAKAQTMLKNNPDADVLFVSEKYIDFEPIVSVERYLTSRSITNRLSLDYRPREVSNDAMELDMRLNQVMGGELGSDHLFDQFSKFEISNKPCYSVIFGSAAPIPACPEIARF